MAPSNKNAQKGNAPTAESGNVMVIILIGIVLFAALAYAIKSGSAPASGIRTAQEAQVVAGRIIEYGNAVEATVNQLMAEGVMPHQLDFGSNIYSRWTATPPNAWTNNPNCASSTCRVFATKGGPLREVTFPEAVTKYNAPYSSDKPYPGHPTVYRANVVNIGSATTNDLVMQMVAISNEVCEAIDQKLGIPSAYSGPSENWLSQGIAGHSGGTDNYWSLDAAGVTEVLGDQNTAIAGKTKGCAKISVNQNVYFHVLLAR